LQLLLQLLRASFLCLFSEKQTLTLLLSLLRPLSTAASYEDLSARETVEMHEVPIASSVLEEQQRSGTTSVRRLVRQPSVMDTQRDSDGIMKMTYWF